jgi:hypothetical protein
MNVAIEDLATVSFTIVRHNEGAVPKVTGSRQSLVILMPVPDEVYNLFPPSNSQSSSNRDKVTFKVTPVFFNIGKMSPPPFVHSKVIINFQFSRY